MLNYLLYVLLLCSFLPLQAQEEEPELLKEYVRSFSLKDQDTILIALNVPYEILEWDRHLIRTFTQMRFLELEVEANGKTYNTISRIGRLYEPAKLLNREIVFIAHNFRQELQNRPNQGMVLVQENENGELGLITKKDIPDFLFLN